MRLLFLNHNVAFRGGTFNRALQIGQRLSARGHDVTLLAISPTARWSVTSRTVGGVTVVETPDLLVGPARTGWDPYDALRRVLFLRGGHWDLIHAWDCRPVVILPALAARRQSGARLVIDWCDWWGRGGTITERSGWFVRTFFGPIETFFEEAFRTRADATTVISSALRDRVIGLGVPADRVHWLPQGSDPAAVPPGDRAAARARLGWSPETPVLGSLGVLLSRDALLLWDTLRQVARQRPDARLVLIGAHRATIPPDLRPAILETGFVSEEALAQYVAAADVMVTPLADTIASRARWPSKLNYYLAAGKPIVVSAVGDCPRLLQERDAAVVVPGGGAALAEATLALLDDPDRRQVLGARARRLAETDLAWETIIDGLLAVYAPARSS